MRGNLRLQNEQDRGEDHQCGTKPVDRKECDRSEAQQDQDRAGNTAFPSAWGTAVTTPLATRLSA